VIETARELVSDRYSISSAMGHGRFRGRDHRLERDVLLWVFEAPTAPERERIAGLASTLARLTHPVFLQTLDLVEDEEYTVIVLEAPDDGEQTAEHPLGGGLPALVAATLTLRIGAALEEAARLGLATPELALSYVHVSGADEVRLDPVGLLTEVEDAYAGLGPLLTEFLASFLPGGGRAGAGRSRFDPGADAAGSFVGRWRERAVRQEAHDMTDLAAFLDELRLIARPPVDSYVEEDAEFRRPAADGVAVATRVPPDQEETIVLPLPDAAPPAVEPARPRRRPPVREARGYGATRAVPRRQSSSALSRLLLVAGIGVIAALGIAFMLIGLDLQGGGSSNGATVDASPPTASSPTPAPADRATLTVVAQQDSQVVISVDGAVAFSGVLRAGESRSWEGNTRVQVWTDNGKNIAVTVNGFSLGPLSPAVGHPDWNTVDWGWQAGWHP